MRTSQLATLGSIVRQWHPQLFVKLALALEAIAPRWWADPSFKYDAGVIGPGSRKSGIAALTVIRQELADMNMKASAMTTEKLLALLAQDGTTRKQQAALIEELKGRLVDEMNSEFFYYLSPSEAARYERWMSGWEDIAARFPDTVRDIEEMNKCFAFSRYTASMFHALHVAEWGAIILGNSIGVIDPKKGWGATERRLREILKSGHADGVGKFEFLEQMNREIDSMVLAWRHKVDHAANHLAIVPNTDFTPDIAEHIIGAVRIFMQRLCEGIPA